MGDEVVVPRWQADDELSACSICRNTFTFLNRRHHCRRCGRLVCGPCSPHRITIPRQYIVRPAEEGFFDRDSGGGGTSGDGGSNTDYLENPALGGGETVRVCNPCVPDPNYGPPPQDQRSPPPSNRSRAQTYTAEESSAAPTGIGFPRGTASSSVSELTATTSRSAPLNGRPLVLSIHSFGGVPSRPQTDIRAGYRPQLHTARYQALNNVPQRPHGSIQGLRTRSDNDTSNSSRTRHRSWSNALAVAGAEASGTGGIAQLPQQLQETREPPREEDECPVCGTKTHPFGSTGTSEERERHVEFCISNHLAGPNGSASNQAAPIQAGVESGAEGEASSSARQRASSVLEAHTARQRMLVYQATEKDCFDEEGEAQECIICFEEFQAGDEMGRLECLCKFHRACIKSWWEKRGRGTCPTHQLHD